MIGVLLVRDFAPEGGLFDAAVVALDAFVGFRNAPWFLGRGKIQWHIDRRLVRRGRRVAAWRSVVVQRHGWHRMLKGTNVVHSVVHWRIWQRRRRHFDRSMNRLRRTILEMIVRHLSKGVE